MLQKVKGIVSKVNKKVTASALAVVAMLAAALPASAAPSTGDTDIDTILTEMETGFSVANKAFVYLALAAVGITVLVVVFFWIRGKFKQAVSGA